ncbi:MAG: tetratricopeptide repeat protein [Anaerolineales bacterium]
MKYSGLVLSLCVVGLSLAAEIAQAADEDTFLGQQILPPSEQAVGQGRSAIWTMPLVATQYQPQQPTPAMLAAIQAQHDNRFLDALILLDEADKSGQTGAETKAEMNLLRASFLLQGNQSKQALENLSPLLANPQHAADAYALTAMAHLQQGQMQQALDAAQHAQVSEGGVLPHLALSYALQGMGRLAEARKEMHDFNTRTPSSAISLAREAELALTLDQISAARTLLAQAQAADATPPYVVAVSGLVYLIDGKAEQAKAAFTTALQRDPKDAKALLGLGLAEIKMGNFKAGQDKLQAADEADPGDALILTYLGRSQQNLGQTEAATASWRSAQQADPKDPVPWLYQAQAALQGNRPLEARDSLREAQARLAYRQVYRGERLLKEDEQLLQANLAEVQRQLGMEARAFQTLSTPVGEKNAANLRNQADVLQGQRFAESARRSLLLQSLFNEEPGNLPSELDIYGDGFGQTGATTPQHGAISELGAQQASYNNYDELFSKRAALQADAIGGSQNTNGEQVRAGVGSDTLGLSVAQRQYKTDGFGLYNNLDNRVLQANVQWRASDSTQLFVSRQTFTSRHGEIRFPADPYNWGEYHQIEDNSGITRLGLRHSLGDNSELRALISHQQTGQTNNFEFIDNTLPYSNIAAPCCGPTLPFPQITLYASSEARSAELQYRRSGAAYDTQWGASAARSPLNGTSFGATGVTNVAQQIYMDWHQALNPYWQLEAGLAWGKNDNGIGANSTYLRRWLPKLGAVYTPDSATHVRLAAWKNLNDAAVGNASLAQASLAGFVLNRQDDTYKLARGLALGADKQLDAAWLLEGQTQRRWADAPLFNGVQLMTTTQIDESRLALHWQPQGTPWIASLAYDDEHIHHDPKSLQNDSVIEQHLRSQQLGLRWLASSQWTASLGWSHNLLSATQQSSDTSNNAILLDIRQSFNQVDASLNWKFNRVGSVDMGVRNATNQSYQYTETDPLVPRFSMGRLSYARLKLVW